MEREQRAIDAMRARRQAELDQMVKESASFPRGKCNLILNPDRLRSQATTSCGRTAS